MLELRDVRRTYLVGGEEIVALDHVDLTIAEGDFMAVIGPSGSGKSTLLQIIGLMDRPSSGWVLLDGNDLGELSDEERTRLRLHTLGFVFQRFHLLTELTAIENVAIPMEAAGVPARERFERAAALLESVEMGHRLHFVPAQLSGGQRQRVAIARALANQPRLILADEPTGELHSEDKARVVELFQRFNQEGKTILVVTHDLVVAEAAERRIELRDGRARELVGAASAAEALHAGPSPSKEQG